MPRLGQIPLGGTATGTGLNTHPDFAPRVRAHLHAQTGLTISPPADPFEAQAARDGLVEASGALKVVAVSLTKIANDLRLMGSGPRAGLGELFLPELQKGSSIMPGKVNPVIPEVVTQVAAQVIGNDTAITIGGMNGQFELNVYVPLMARNLLQSIQLLASASRLLAEKCVDGIEAEPRAERALRRADAVGGDRAQPAHRLRQGHGAREGGCVHRPLAARGGARDGRRGSRTRPGARLPPHGEAARIGRRKPGRRSLTREWHDPEGPGRSLVRWVSGGSCRGRIAAIPLLERIATRGDLMRIPPRLLIACVPSASHCSSRRSPRRTTEATSCSASGATATVSVAHADATVRR